MNPIPCSKAHGIAKLGGALLLLFTLAPLAPAELAVNWGGDYVPNTYNTPNPDPLRPGVDSSYRYGGFVGGDPQLLSPAADYSGTSATFYGAVTSTAANPLVSGVMYSGTGSIDRIQLKGPDSGLETSAYLLLWDQADFLSGLNTGNVGFTATDTLTLNVVTYVQFSPGRIVLRQGVSYYVSEATFTGLGTFNRTPASMNWFNYNPAVDGLSAIGSAATIVSGGQIANISEIGFLFTSTNSVADAVRIQDFDVTLTAIPEPAAAGVLLGGFGLLVVLRRRFRR